MARKKLIEEVKEAATEEVTEAETQAESIETDAQAAGQKGAATTGKKAKRVCLFCEGKTEPSYTDTATLKRFMSDRSRIITKAKTGVCSKHQRRVGREIKRARHLSLLPFVPTV